MDGRRGMDGELCTFKAGLREMSSTNNRPLVEQQRPLFEQRQPFVRATTALLKRGRWRASVGGKLQSLDSTPVFFHQDETLFRHEGHKKQIMMLVGSEFRAYKHCLDVSGTGRSPKARREPVLVCFPR